MDRPFNDILEETYRQRLEIGFLPSYTQWTEAPAHFSDHALEINGHPVMEDWEDGYMKELAAIACARGGTVLEVGFGMGISARYVQAQGIAEHLIIESNADVFKKLREFAIRSSVKTMPLFGFWQNVTPTLPAGSIDGILFDTYPLTSEEIHRNHFNFFKEAWRLLRPGGVLTYYSDEIEDFSSEHVSRLHQTGFMRIEKKVVAVEPSADCKYWRSKTIVAPIITKEHA